MDKTLEPSDGNEMICERCKELEAENDTLTAQVARLREALLTVDRRLDTPNYSAYYSEICRIIEEALTSTPADDLAEYRDGVLEKEDRTS